MFETTGVVFHPNKFEQPATPVVSLNGISVQLNTKTNILVH